MVKRLLSALVFAVVFPACGDSDSLDLEPCTPVACDITCPNGFEVDEFGCVACDASRCAEPRAFAACETAADCVEVEADCCGCVEGGRNTAVASTTADEHQNSLMCTEFEQCVTADRCDGAAAPRCILGTCELTSAPLEGIGALCGRPGLECGAGQTCVINEESDRGRLASGAGFGLCRHDL